MEKKLVIEILKKLPFEDLSVRLADSSEKIDSGSGACITASVAASFLKRAAEKARKLETGDQERIDYICRNTEIIRNYMVHLIDEDVRCRGPLRKASETGDPDKIDACCQSACAIAFETVEMMKYLLGFCEELTVFFTDDIPHYVFEAASLAYASVETASAYINSVTRLNDDETYIFVTNREAEIFLEECGKLKKKIDSARGRIAAYEVKK